MLETLETLVSSALIIVFSAVYAVAAIRDRLERDDLTHEQCTEIDEILDVDELSIEYRSTWTIGE
ncbi:hypothetical protein [Haloterrigena salifodinae]|uniref:hypothetical protein n=1 Tax=Haloterrigena salifodinae TaxID=2675099 RepID=UPI000F8627B5|nr:hypothetical protein [Haloterrigena salifodinae]